MCCSRVAYYHPATVCYMARRADGGGKRGRQREEERGGGDRRASALSLPRLPLSLIHSLAPLVFLSAVCHTVLLSRLTHLPCLLGHLSPLPSPLSSHCCLALLPYYPFFSSTFPSRCLHHTLIFLPSPCHLSFPVR